MTLEKLRDDDRVVHDRVAPRNPKELGGIPDHRSDGVSIMGILRGDEKHEHGTDFILYGIC